MKRKTDPGYKHEIQKPEPVPFAKIWERESGRKQFLNYKRELDAKQKALNEFWTDRIGTETPVPEIVPSPKPRNYRTTSKRKAVFAHGTLNFTMGYTLKKGPSAPVEGGAELEDESHGIVYDAALTILRKPHFAPLAKALNFCIVRGKGENVCVILNVFRMSSEVVRKAKMFADEISAAASQVRSTFLYFDETRSEYYFESFRPRTAVNFKKLYGPSMLALELPDGPKLLYPPTVFSQVNESILPDFIRTAITFLDLTPATRFIDLYCGYGLFALSGAKTASSVIGMDFEGPAIQAARGNAEHIFPGKNIRFEASAVTPESLTEFLPPPDPRIRETILLDPPRSGTSDGVISAIASRHPERVVSIYCGIDQMAKEFHIWQGNGFRAQAVKCFDMFPASPNLETMILWMPVRP